MDIDFGLVDRYVADRGFGFVGRVFGGDIEPPRQPSRFRRNGPPRRSNDTFFHISAIRSSLPDIANGLQESGVPGGRAFWYVSESTAKGRQVVEALPPDAVHARISDDLDRYRDRLMTLWCNAGGRDIAPWLRGLTEQVLVTPQCFSDWEGEVSERALRSRIQEKIKTGRNRHISNWKSEQVEEFIALVREMKSQGFGGSSDVSKYIVKNRLGEKYKNISGWLDFEAGGDKWTFKGGIAPHVYGMLCTELGLGDNRSGARPTDFVPFKDRPA